VAARAGRHRAPTVRVLADLLGHARAQRSWLPLVLVLIAVLAAAVAVVGQAAAPWAIYPAL
jgi:hypothetical protein